MALFLFILVFLAGGVVIFMGISIYNGLVALRNEIERSWANIEVILKQRFEELPQLVQVIEQYANYEQTTLKKVIEARQVYLQARTTDQKIEAAGLVGSSIHGLLALGEAYPDLKANPSFMRLQDRVSELEGQIADRRENFNETVTHFNTRLEQIPDVFIARLLGYSPRTLFRVEASEQVKPSLKMRLGS